MSVEFEATDGQAAEKRKLKASEVYEICKRLTDEQCKILGESREATCCVWYNCQLQFLLLLLPHRFDRLQPRVLSSRLDDLA